MNDSLWTFGFEIANFVTLAVFLGWFLFKPVREAIELEQNKILQLEQAAQDKLAEADRTNQEIATKYKDLDAELEKIRAASREAANQERERLLAEVHAEVATERDQLKQQAKQSQQIQAAHLAQSVVESTCILTDRLLHQIDGPELEQALIDAALREWKVLPTGTHSSISVESSVPLDDKTRQRIREVVSPSGDSVSFRVAPELRGGLRISTEQGLIDATIAGLLRHAEHALMDNMNGYLQEASVNE